MKQQCKPLTWMPLALAGLALACCPGPANAATNILVSPAAIQPGGGSTDTALDWGVWFNNASGLATEDLDLTVSSTNTIAGSIHVTLQCLGDSGDGSSANLAFGNWLNEGSGGGGWLGAPNALTVDAGQYASLDMDVLVNTEVSSNTPIPINLWGAAYDNASIGSVAITNTNWQHLSFPIPASVNVPDCVAYGFYDWYNTTPTTPPAYVEFWMDNIQLVARPVVIPPPTLSIAPLTQSGLFIDSGPGEGGDRGAIDSIVDMHWIGLTAGSPVTYSMTIGSVPNPLLYSNWEAHIFLAPSSGVGNPDWNLSDCGYLQILDNNDGSATARLMWKTNDPNDNTMMLNTNFGIGGSGANSNQFAAGTIGYLNASQVLGTWSITFTSDTNLTLSGPGGAGTNFILPPDWMNSFNNAGSGYTYAYFGGGPNGNANAGQHMTLSSVSINGGANSYAYTNDFSTLAYDTATWALLGSETMIIPQPSGWWLWWTLPAANFGLWSSPTLGSNSLWLPVSANTNLPTLVTPYTWGTNMKALVLSADLPATNQSFFELRKLVASQLQVLLPGETAAPGTPTGKTGTPDIEYAGSFFNLTVNAVDKDWNVVSTVTDTIQITSSDTDTNASMPPNAALVKGTGQFTVIFGVAGNYTVTATDVTDTAITPDTSTSVECD